MGLMNPMRDLVNKTPSLKAQKYSGVVVDIDDPMKLQRVKIRIPQLHRGIPDEDLPWSMPQRTGQANSAGGTGTVRVPPKGTKVYSQFENGDPHFPQYSHSPTTEDVQKDHPLVKDEDYPHVYGEVDQAGNMWAVNTKKKTSMYLHKSGSSIKFMEDGTIMIASAKGVMISGKDGVSIVSDTGLTMSSKQGTTIAGAPITSSVPIEPGGAPTMNAEQTTEQQTPNIPDSSNMVGM